MLRKKFTVLSEKNNLWTKFFVAEIMFFLTILSASIKFSITNNYHGVVKFSILITDLTVKMSLTNSIFWALGR